MRLSAFASAHSHAFQRAMRGRAQRRTAGRDDFWSWRAAMYALARSLDPESIARVSEVAFSELAALGVRTVGEFHYVHHQPDGTPYAERTILAEAVIEAARRAKMRIALLRVAYARAGAGLPPEPDQRRFCDPDPELVLRDVETLRSKYAGDDDVVIGVAPHSVRAVPPAWLKVLADGARSTSAPMHMHVAEQPKEIDACVAETGRRPVELLADLGVLDASRDRFVAVHATHLLAHEAKLLGDVRAFACICPTTERDLGDGTPNLAELRAAGVRICVGVDSHVVTDPLEEIRALETNERLRTLSRVTHENAGKTCAESLWEEGSTNGARACGFADAGGEVEIDVADPSLAVVDREVLLDAVVFGANGRVVKPGW